MLQRSYLFVVEGKTRRIQDAPEELPVCSKRKAGVQHAPQELPVK